MSEYRYLIIGIVIGIVAIYVLYITVSKKNNNPKHSALGWFAWGPFWPSINKYFKERDGLSKREKIGWAIVALVMLLAILSDCFFPIK